ncbi:hypothetical protein UlMin_035136 [Ulmus minor]
MVEISNFMFLMIAINISFLVFSEFCQAADFITQAQTITESQTLLSESQIFELGFFSPGTSKNRYLGIWYKNFPVKTVVWVANRLHPIKDLSGSLIIDDKGNLVLSSKNGTTWPATAKPVKQAQEPILQLLDSGNLVLKSQNSEEYLWQSFDYPTDTLLPGMKLGWDLKTALNRRLSAWKSIDDPSPGDLTLGIELHSYPEQVMFKDSEIYIRTGPWNGLQYSGESVKKTNSIFDFKFVFNSDEVYYMYNLKNNSMLSRMYLNQTYNFRQRYIWVDGDKDWRLYSSMPRDYCDRYDHCGAYGECISELPICRCLEGFKPKSPEKWNESEWKEGCERNKPLNCQSGDWFVKYEGLKLPDTTHTWVNTSMSLKECEAKCMENCSCMALNAKAGQKRKITIAVVTIICIISAMIFIVYYILRRTKIIRDKEQEEDLELPIFHLSTIARATDNFSTSKKLGEGGFGPVYKGKLGDGQEIAVKRLSRSSGQGLNEFKNEVILIAKVQHRNLVKLLGCCIEGEEKLLIYEYMPNKSLDSFIFDQTKGKLLDWSKRFSIICGIARGLVYLHQDSRLRIIHRDLKASNVLLDNEMTPKISDFGLARTFGGNQIEANTNRVVGTYGYMAPEYASNGLFSIKSDVFSFGVSVIEIISGKKNRVFHPNQSINLIGHAWRLWKEGNPSELIDECLVGSSCVVSQVLHCIHVSLLCVQQRAEDRPTMSSVVFMLGSETTVLPQPKQPGFFIQEESIGPSTNQEPNSTNEVTISLLEAR